MEHPHEVQERENEHKPSPTSSSSLAFPQVVHLNVGGYIYATTHTTLRMDSNSMLFVMFSSDISTTKDEKGRYFIDRDGKLFRFILNYLRDGTAIVPENLKREVLQEARLEQLCEYLEESLPSSIIEIKEEVREIKQIAKQADKLFRVENEAAIERLTSQAKTLVRQNGSSIPVDIRINTNYFAPPLFKAAANDRIRQMVLEDITREGFTFRVSEDCSKERGKEWIFVLDCNNFS